MLNARIHPTILSVPCRSTLATQHGSELVSLMGGELAAWEAAKRSLANANRQQEANLAKQRNSLLQMVSAAVRFCVTCVTTK